jgi:hypothetical protein
MRDDLYPSFNPGFSDVSFTAWWESHQDLPLKLPFCQSCKRHHFYPQPFCPHCGSGDISAGEVSGKGTLYSFTIVHRAPSALFKDDVPYVVGVVQTLEGPNLMARIECEMHEQLQIGVPVHFKCLKNSPQASAALFPVFILS